MIKNIKIIIFCLLLQLPFDMYAQRFILANKNKAIYDCITKGDSSFFGKDYHTSIAFYQKVIASSYDEYAFLNQVQNYLASNSADAALHTLSVMADSNFYKFWILDKDTAYLHLKNVPGYGPVRQRIEDNFIGYVKQNHISNPALTQQLMWMFYQDQYYQWISTFKRRYQTAYENLSDTEVEQSKKQIFSQNIAFLKNLFAKNGYPWYKDVGIEATHYTWLIVQHADEDLPFQQQYLQKLQTAVNDKNASPLDLAYLTDRIKKNMGEKQIYGTQMSYRVINDPVKGRISTMELWPVEAKEQLDERRKSVGLMPMTQYMQLMKQINGH